MAASRLLLHGNSSFAGSVRCVASGRDPNSETVTCDDRGSLAKEVPLPAITWHAVQPLAGSATPLSARAPDVMIVGRLREQWLASSPPWAPVVSIVVRFGLMAMLRRTLSLQFIQKHKMGRSSCDAFGLAFAVMSNFSFKVARKHNLGRSSCHAFGRAYTVFVQLQLAVCSKPQSGEIQL